MTLCLLTSNVILKSIYCFASLCLVAVCNIFRIISPQYSSRHIIQNCQLFWFLFFFFFNLQRPIRVGNCKNFWRRHCAPETLLVGRGLLYLCTCLVVIRKNQLLFLAWFWLKKKKLYKWTQTQVYYYLIAATILIIEWKIICQVALLSLR